MRKAKWDLNLSLQEARTRDEIIALADSQELRFIDEINGNHDIDIKAKEIAKQIKKLKKQPTSAETKKSIRKLYEELDSIQFKQDYVSIIIDKKSDYLRATKGFKINGIEFVRLLGTNGGVKNSTIVFVSKSVGAKTIPLIENGRNPNKEFVPAKLEAYKALVCSGSIPVSDPEGVLVVPDCVTEFLDDYLIISDEGADEPTITEAKNQSVELIDSDGYGLMLPSRAIRWSLELGEDYLPSGMCIRNSWTKGMLFTFDFHSFAEKIAHNYIVKDIWGREVDIRKVEVILTGSMLKLWDSYSSWDDYWTNCKKNNYSFCVTKVCPKELENERNLNYQFIQTFNLSDGDISELCYPTIREIKDVLGDDYRKSILFLKGTFMEDDSFSQFEPDFAKALLISEEMINDPFVRSKIRSMIRKRINEAKVGVLKISGNFALLSGDPYSLCQSVFGLEVTGLLKAGQSYHKYWIDKNIGTVLAFRAPMTSHNNIRMLSIAHNNEMDYWYQYMNTCVILNSWDMTCHACNGADKDGDLLLTTDNNVLLRNYIRKPAIQCVQRKASKTIPHEDDFIKSNIANFGEEIGSITNKITSMIEMQSVFSKDSEEWNILDYRIKCGQKFQQDSIDKAKGIISKPMPRFWYDTTQCSDNQIFRNIAAKKKPYFMKYIYPDLMKKYNSFISGTRKKCLREFGISFDELIAKKNKTAKEYDFIKYYKDRHPVGTSQCVMNRICRLIESEFDNTKLSDLNRSFDCALLKSGTPYSKARFNEIKRVYDDYILKTKEFARASANRRISDKDDVYVKLDAMKRGFTERCETICPNELELCDIVIDLCYNNNNSKQFAWDICGSRIIENLLDKSNGNIAYPAKDLFGDISFNGEQFRMIYAQIGDD